MGRPERMGLLIVALLMAGLLGCASYPISKQFRASVSKDVNFTMVLRNPSAYVGAKVIWGGRIVETTNSANGSEIIILETPLMGYEEPAPAEYSPGRFIAESTEFLDPAIYKAGKRVTIAGEVTGGTTKPLGSTEYTYPVVTIDELHLWSEPHYYAYEPYDYWPWWMDYGWINGPGYWSYYPGFIPGGEFEEGEHHEGGGEHHEGGGEREGGGGHEGGDRR